MSTSGVSRNARVFGMLQDLAEVAERLLIAKNIEVQRLHIINQGRQTPAG